EMTEYTDTSHAFDYPSLPSKPTNVPYAQTTHCVLKEEPIGTIINVVTHKPFTYVDDCLGRNAHVAYSAKATRATEEAIRVLLKTVFKLLLAATSDRAPLHSCARSTGLPAAPTHWSLPATRR